MKQAITCDGAPAAIGPYSQAVRIADTLYISGQLGMCPDGALAGVDAAAQADQALGNIAAILEAAGMTLAQVVKVTIYLTDLSDFETVNRIYATFFDAPYPARACVEVARLPRDAKVEMDAVAQA